MILGGSSHRRFVLFRSYCQKKYDVEWILQKSNVFIVKVQCEENKTVLARDTIFCLHVR